MKRTLINIIISLVLVDAGNVIAQTKPTYSSINRDAYVGMWEYATSTDTLRIEFQKCKRDLIDAFDEGLCGGYRYKKNGLTVEDNITTINVEDPIIWGSNVVLNRPDLMDPNELKIGFSDTPKRKYLEGFFTIISENPKTARLKLYEPDVVVLDGNENDPLEGTTIPLEVILTKISNPPPGYIPPVDLPRFNRPFLPPQDKPPVPPRKIIGPIIEKVATDSLRLIP